MPKKKVPPQRYRPAPARKPVAAAVARTAHNAASEQARTQTVVFAMLRYLPDGGAAGAVPEVIALTLPLRSWKALEEAAMEWTYVLRSRQRWAALASAAEEHVERAAAQLHEFGLSPAAIADMARAQRVEVQVELSPAADSRWATRVLPWEYIVAAATRPYRHGEIITVTRMLKVGRAPPINADLRADPLWGERGPRVLYVESAPGEIAKTYDFHGERDIIDVYLMNGCDASQLRRVYSPTLAQLAEAVARHKPHIVHLAGIDNHAAEIELHSAGTGERARVGPTARNTSRPDADYTENWKRDGFLLSGSKGEPWPAGFEELAKAVTANGDWHPWLVSTNFENSAARVGARLVQAGCMAAVGFQDAFDMDLAELFYGTLYAELRNNRRLPDAFSLAWKTVRQRHDVLLGTGLVLWTDFEQISDPGHADIRQVERQVPVEVKWTPPASVDFDWVRSHVKLQIKAKKAINYSLLHNGGELFDEFSIMPAPDFRGHSVEVRVLLSAGAETASFERVLDLEGRPLDLQRQVRVSLSASLIRSVHEAITTTLVVDIKWGSHVLARETFPVSLLPIDQWRDAVQGRSWLPSFVFPRDRAVLELVRTASNYVRVLRDDPAAGFEGYQCLDEDPTPRDAAQVDLQVQAVWAAIVHEWRLTYINPPPSYSAELDSQRLRTPSMIMRDRNGTCIDLALLFAACLELVDIWPVIFLLEDHAFPGYWRADAFHDRFRSARPEEGAMREIMSANADVNSAAGAQRYPWAVGRAMQREILREIRAGRLVPLETVRLTENCGFAEAIEAGKENFEDPEKFEFLIDIALARQNGITPLPLLGDPS